MRRVISLVVMSIIMSSSMPALSEEKYDPHNTMLALNMAIVSVHRIVTTEDRIVLQHEYDNIINKLALGNIESDYEMTGLYSELMNFITGKGLRKDESEKLREKFKRREQKQIIEAFSKIKAKGNNLRSVIGNLAVSCVSSYLECQNARAELLEGFDNEMWRLKKEDIEECNRLQVMLLNASWNLLRQYKLPDEYRLTQDSLNGFYKAVNESDPSKRLRMLRARNVERNFQMYPPYWYYRAKAAIESNDDEEATRCYDKFAEVWRPVLRNDPYKLEEAKYRVQRLAANSEAKREEIRRLLGVIQDNTTAGDWSNNLFVGVAYFLLGDEDEGIACVEVNIDFSYEYEISEAVLAKMRNDEFDVFTFKSRDLTRKDIVAITTKYGYSSSNDDKNRYKWEVSGAIGSHLTEIYTCRWLNIFPLGHGAAFCLNGIFTHKEIFFIFFGHKGDFLSYDELRHNSDINLDYLKKRFPEQGQEFFLAVMELKELMKMKKLE